MEDPGEYDSNRSTGAESAVAEERKRFFDTRTFVEDAENAEAHGVAAESNTAISSREERFIFLVRSGDVSVATVPRILQWSS